MFVVTVSASFQASHNLRTKNGTREPVHSHVWNVEACFAGPNLDDMDVLVDFTVAGGKLREIADSLSGTYLNEWPPMVGTNPSAERVARAIFDRLGADPALARCLQSVKVTEAPGCSAAYVRGRPDPGSLEWAAVDDKSGC